MDALHVDIGDTMTDHTLILWQHDWLQKGHSTQALDAMTTNLRWFAEWLGRPLDTATLPELLAYLAEKQALSAHRCHNAWRALRSYYSYAGELDGVPSLMARVKCPKLPESAKGGADAASVTQLLNSLDGQWALRDKAIVLLLQATGMRVGEISRLTIDNLNVEQRCLIVTKSKTGKPRVIPIDQAATVALVKYLRMRAKLPDAALPDLWLGRRGVLSLKGIHQMFRDRNRKALTSITPHQFRRSFAVGWLVQGGSQTSLQSICGWANGQMVSRYTKFAAGELAMGEYRRLFG
jgi:site-specific recombinase XerD